MIQNIRVNTFWLRLSILVITALLFFAITSCQNNTDKQARASGTNSVIANIDSVEQFNKITATAEDRLLILDFYADWCPPCKELEPILEKIAKENRASVTVYKVNIDRNRELVHSFRVGGIPHVAFVKNKENVLSLTGVYPKNMYLKAVERFSATAAP